MAKPGTPVSPNTALKYHEVIDHASYVLHLTEMMFHFISFSRFQYNLAVFMNFTHDVGVLFFNVFLARWWKI